MMRDTVNDSTGAVVPRDVTLPQAHQQQLVPNGHNGADQHMQPRQLKRSGDHSDKLGETLNKKQKEEKEEEEERKRMIRTETEVFYNVFKNHDLYSLKQLLKQFSPDRLFGLCSQEPFPLHGIIRKDKNNRHPESLRISEQMVILTLVRNPSIISVRDSFGNMLIDLAIHSTHEDLVVSLNRLGTPLCNENNAKMGTVDNVIFMMHPTILHPCIFKGLTCHYIDPRHTELEHYKRSLNFFKKQPEHKQRDMVTTFTQCSQKLEEFFKNETMQIPIADSSQLVSVPVGKVASYGRNHVVFFRFPQLNGECDFGEFRLVIIPAYYIHQSNKLERFDCTIELETNPKLNDTECFQINGDPAKVFDCSTVVHSQMTNPRVWYNNEVDPTTVFKLELQFPESEDAHFALCQLVRIEEQKPETRYLPTYNTVSSAIEEPVDYKPEDPKQWCQRPF